ncbi:hypothetical protein CEUSTIGMA_g5437.t1 [Chlamydomonas eustigma]|uniref:Metallo-beta-lactamase domain-containing protein n=1 Tax=Chlamydomonas eustigma TaxID=1157962 RepID=A0A250X4J3_9CHLO|nr:hypothetical protein CEUSTIGMA_g5437.t1 [Chlamydomonas eustigma]|eukprot:GAX77995.1 hypothetical protein CEUSTIGMA_g5437.t1 [Chlamydomonas eustigma]
MFLSGMHTKSSFHHGVTVTSYEANSFAVKFNNSGVRVLVDPWLVGELVFFEQDWLYKGKKRVLNGPGKVNIDAIAAETDVVVITQYLPDHCHLPTLSKLPKNLPIIANPGAFDLIQSLGFSKLQQLDHGQTLKVADGRLEVTATEGALVGPPWSKRQNGILMREVATKTEDGDAASLYYEAHCDFVESSLKNLGKVDVVISPVKTTLLGNASAGYPLVMGDLNIMKLISLLRPKVLVPLLNAEIDQEGPLSSIVVDRGDYQAVTKQITSAQPETRVEFPAPPGEAFAVAL